MLSFIKKKKYLIIFIFIIIIVPIIYISINNIINKPTGKENITTKLYNDTDYLNWFIDFDNLYTKKVKSPKYSLTKDSFISINNLINNQSEKDIYFKDNIYYLNNSTIELDTNTRSLRYIKYQNNEITEILEIRLLNGKYYVQLKNNQYLYKIVFNKKQVKNKKYQDKTLIIKESIFKNKTFNW